jgi:hypothetical protein
MSFLKKLFGKREEPATPTPSKDPDNTKLNFLLRNWGDNQSDQNYRAVIDELMHGNAFLILPSLNESNSVGWQTAQQGSTLKLASVFNLDGLMVLGAFSTEDALLGWTKSETEYTAMKAQDVLEFCRIHGIGRLVINSDQKDMFVLERNRSNITTTVVEKDMEVLLGTPAKPLKQEVIQRLVESFKKVDTIEEAYQYAQQAKNEISIVLGIKLSVVSDNSRTALQNAVTHALEGQTLEMPVDVFVLETEDWLRTVRGIERALFYQRTA